MSAKGLTLLIASTAVLIALLTEVTSFWMDVLRLPRVVSMKFVICESGVRWRKENKTVVTNLLSGSDENGERPTDDELEEA